MTDPRIIECLNPKTHTPEEIRIARQAIGWASSQVGDDCGACCASCGCNTLLTDLLAAHDLAIKERDDAK